MSILEWDYRHGRIEKYDSRGNHCGEYDPMTGRQLKGPLRGRKVQP
jgi:Cytotoxic